MAITRQTGGVFPIVPTPFKPDGAIDSASLDRLVDFDESTGVDGLTILGRLGKAQKLLGEEMLRVAERVLARASVPVVVGVSLAGLVPMADLAT
jgi:4-hydroxy-tetrahydrodipicolinate synthase